MPEYSHQEKENIETVRELFDVEGSRDKLDLIAEDAVWWDGLPFIGGDAGQTEHRGHEGIGKILSGAGSASGHAAGIDAYDLSTARNEDVVVLADGDYVVRQHTCRATTHGGQDYTNVYCFVFRFNADGRIGYLTEHWNTWHAYNVLFNNFELEPAHPEVRERNVLDASG